MRVNSSSIVWASALILLNTGCQGLLGSGFEATSLSSSTASVSVVSNGFATLGYANTRFAGEGALRTLDDKTNSDTLIFHKYVNRYDIPAGVTGVTGFRGFVSAAGTGNAEFNLLFTVGFSPGGHCPASGSVFDDYPQKSAIPDYHELATFIVKGFQNDSQIENIDISLPEPIGVSGCIFTIVDGGYVGSGSLRMVADVTLETVKQKSAPGQHLSLGDEFCTGMTAGCLLATSLRQATLAAKHVVTQSGTLFSLYGSISEQATQRVASPWTATHGFYLDRGCSHMPANGDDWLYGPGNYNAILNATTTKLMEVTLGNPAGNSTVHQSSMVQPLAIHVNAGDCIVHTVQVDNPYAPVSSETQIQAILLPDGASQNITQAPVDSPVQISRFWNSQSGDHLLTSNSAEVAGNAAWASEGTNFNIPSLTGVAGTTPLYRCLLPNGRHLVTADPNCEGNRKDLTLGSIYTQQYAGTMPLYRFYLPSTGDHLLTTAMNEALPLGYEFEAIAGWVAPPKQVVAPPPTPVVATPPVTPNAKSDTGAASANPLTPVYRFFSPTNGDHVFTTSYAEMASTGYTLEGVAFNTLQNAGSDLLLLNRCYSGGYHFLSLDANCEGTTHDGSVGYVHAAQVNGTSLIHRYWNAGNRLETTDPTEGAGWSGDGSLGYAY